MRGYPGRAVGARACSQAADPRGRWSARRGKPAGPWRAVLSAPPSPSPSHPSGLCQPGVRGGVAASPKICGELWVPLEMVAFQPPRVMPRERGLLLPLCRGISALLMVQKATQRKKKAIFLQALYTLMLGGGEGLSHRHSSPDAGAHRSQWYLAMPAAELWVILATR